ncbi:MAG TPA: hypothetical protein DCQ64_18900 [Candidatus Rokubacteria bacterium]|nr:hypothetical protein [Candidatus Rokubacteria bacterium]
MTDHHQHLWVGGTEYCALTGYEFPWSRPSVVWLRGEWIDQTCGLPVLHLAADAAADSLQVPDATRLASRWDADEAVFVAPDGRRWRYTDDDDPRATAQEKTECRRRKLDEVRAIAKNYCEVEVTAAWNAYRARVNQAYARRDAAIAEAFAAKPVPEVASLD